MKIFITDEQKAELEHLLASEGWASVMIAQALRLHETTVNQHINDYVNTCKLKPENGGSASRPNVNKQHA